MELRWALEARRNLIFVMETDDRHGKPNMEELIQRPVQSVNLDTKLRL